MTSSEVRGDLDFDYVLGAEIGDINLRRAALGRAAHAKEVGRSDQRQMLDMAGVALSGGGIRSASFCLGVLQGLNHYGAIRNIDYLSSVSGGGYTGCSLTATMTATGGAFPYGSGPPSAGGTPSLEISDTPAVSHIRNYSNYLIPYGPRDVLTAAGIIFRGLAANAGSILGILLLLAALTFWLNPRRSALVTPDLPHQLADLLPSQPFGFTAALLIVLPVVFFLWAFYRSLLQPMNLAEFRTRLPRYAAASLVVLSVAAFCELQPFVINGMFGIADADTIAALTGKAPAPGGVFFGLVVTWIEALALITTPIAAAVTLFRKTFADLISAASATSRLRTKIAGLLAKAAVWVAGAALPLLIWIGYLYLSYWAIPDNTLLKVPAVACASDGASGSFRLGEPGLAGSFDARLSLDKSAPCVPAPAHEEARAPFAHAPAWIASAGVWMNRNVLIGSSHPPPAPVSLYVPLGALLLFLALLLRPNANSLHRLYRDRLSKAFLFDPGRLAGTGTTPRDEGRIAGTQDLAPLDTMRLTDIDPKSAPYQLINAALNIQGSDFANRRGRNADFFLFSRRYVGSAATGYAETQQVQKVTPDLDLATALAISGAAASANMGSKSIRALTPTLALLNVRLGFWLRNPYFAYRDEPDDASRAFKPVKVWSYLLAEITSSLNEDSANVYVTDGGHIENLGIYELLRRRCRLIVAVDAEADPEMRFTALVTLQRYARIDLGVRIRIPLEKMAEIARAWMGVGGRTRPKSDLEPTHGPHIAVGTIDYGDGNIGHLVYLKASLSGDENDYVRDYARRYDLFPHETTGDQFFNEEQFEVYRALGFHAMSGFLAGTDDVLVETSLANPPRPDPAPGGPTWPLGSAPGTPPPARPPRSTADTGTLVRADDPGLTAIRDRLTASAGSS